MSFPSHNAHMAALISVSLALSQTPVYTARPRIRRVASASRGVPVYVPAFADARCVHPRRGGQAELTSSGTKPLYSLYTVSQKTVQD